MTELSFYRKATTISNPNARLGLYKQCKVYRLQPKTIGYT
jgi:hypothetical protein